jgi:hypothetical protein
VFKVLSVNVLKVLIWFSYHPLPLMRGTTARQYVKVAFSARGVRLEGGDESATRALMMFASKHLCY